jgi:hypothetical protein
LSELEANIKLIFSCQAQKSAILEYSLDRPTNTHAAEPTATMATASMRSQIRGRGSLMGCRCVSDASSVAILNLLRAVGPHHYHEPGRSFRNPTIGIERESDDSLEQLTDARTGWVRSAGPTEEE